MSDNRIRRVAGQIKKDVSQIIGDRIKDPRVAEITSVTEVQLTRDLRYASVYVSIFGSEPEKEETLNILNKASGYIRGEVGKRIRLRYIPEITFFIDNSIEYGVHIEKVIKSLKNEEKSEYDRSDENN